MLKRAPEHVPSLVLAGAVELQAGQAATAEGYLRKAVALAPQHAGARRMLVRTYLGAHQPAKALESIQPMLASGTPQRSAITVTGGRNIPGERRLEAGVGLLRCGCRHQTAGVVCADATWTDRAGQGRRRHRNSRTRGGHWLLDDAPMQADMALIIGHAKKNDLNRALCRPPMRSLRNIRPIRCRSSCSERFMWHAMTQLPRAPPSRRRWKSVRPTCLRSINLARLDIAENKPADARKRLDALIAKDPKNEQALLA